MDILDQPIAGLVGHPLAGGPADERTLRVFHEPLRVAHRNCQEPSQRLHHVRKGEVLDGVPTSRFGQLLQQLASVVAQVGFQRHHMVASEPRRHQGTVLGVLRWVTAYRQLHDGRLGWPLGVDRGRLKPCGREVAPVQQSGSDICVAGQEPVSALGVGPQYRLFLVDTREHLMGVQVERRVIVIEAREVHVAAYPEETVGGVGRCGFSPCWPSSLVGGTWRSTVETVDGSALVICLQNDWACPASRRRSSLRSASSTYAPGTPSSAGLARNAAAVACHPFNSQTDH